MRGKQFTNDLSQEIYEQTYRYGDENIEKTQKRIADDIASIETDKDKWFNEFLSILEDFKFVPGGRIISNAGTQIRGTTYINCFTSDAKVLTKFGYKNISDIEIGDEVLTHLGRFRKVVNTMERFYEGKINVYSSSNLISDIKATPEHPFYQGKNEWVISDKNEKLVLFNYKEEWKWKSGKDTINLYEYVKDIKRKGVSKNSVIKEDKNIYTTTDFIGGNGSKVTKKGEPLKNIITIDEDFAYFIGRFVGDGSTFCVNNSYEVDGFNIVFNNKEKKSAERIKDILFKKVGISMNENKGDFDGFYLRKNSPLFSYFLMKTCGRYSDTKMVPEYIWNSDNKIKMSFLLGLFDADGTITDRDIKITLNNEKLISDIQAMLLQIGIPSTKNSVYVKEYPDKVYYQLSLTTLYSKEFIKLLSKIYDDNRISEFLLKNITDENKGQFPYSVKIEENDIDGKIFIVNKFNKTEENLIDFVYNISVEEDESYVVNNVVVHNCFVDGFVGKNQDSVSGILEALRRQAFILKSEGGYGFCADVMRPRGGYIEGIANDTPGAVKWLDNWNTQSDVITAGSGRKSGNVKAKQKIRKGAQMVTLSCWHPDIEEFITAKQTSGRLDKFNMSVLITDAFMNAVIKGEKWDLIFPDFDKVKEIYNDSWDGNIGKWVSEGNPVKIYKSFKDANELWDLILKSTYNRNEPGVLFVDTMNRLNNLSYCEYISATNPCGEQILPIGGVCLLGNLNLTQFINNGLNDWDYEKLAKIIPVAVRFMDNVNDLTYVPLDDQKENLMNKRRIGLGILGYGSALLIMKKRYGSPEALNLTEKLMNFISNTAYQSSALLAKEKGSFTLYNEEKYLKSEYLKNLSEETKDLIKKYGIRNSHLLSVQPTGNSSILSNVASGGLEPVFLFEYVRTVIQPYAPEGLSIPTTVDWAGLTYTQSGNQNWRWVKEGDENMLKTDFNGMVFKFDRGRGLLKESVVKDYGVKFLEDIGQWNPSDDWAANINNLKIDEHINTMKVISRYIDSAMSKTINLPSDYKFEDFKNVYMDLYKSGTIKGGTTYRAGTMATVIKKKEDDDPVIGENNVPKRPKILDCDVVRFTNKGEKWIGFIGVLKGRPYEIFTGLAESFVIPNWVEKGQIRKEKIKNKEDVLVSRYDFIYLDKEGYEVIMTALNRSFSREYWNIGKMTSALLRHHIHLPSVVEIIESLNLDGDTMGTWKKGMTRMLKRYIKEDKEEGITCLSCGSTNLIHKESCISCLDCGWEKCE